MPSKQRRLGWIYVRTNLAYVRKVWGHFGQKGPNFENFVRTKIGVSGNFGIKHLWGLSGVLPKAKTGPCHASHWHLPKQNFGAAVTGHKPCRTIRNGTVYGAAIGTIFLGCASELRIYITAISIDHNNI